MKQLVAYITCAYPDVNFTTDLALSMKQNGADILELGIPFSDPVADGPVIEKANKLALESGFKLQSLYDVTQNISSVIQTYWMGYANTFFSQGFDSIAQRASTLGVQGFIIPDLPYEEASKQIKALQKNDIKLVSFVAPTDSGRRIRKLVIKADGFIYLVAYAGITGDGKSEDLDEVIREIRKNSATPLYIGFGVNAKNAKHKAQNVDGVIVGSEFVKVLIDESLTNTQKIDTISALTKQIKESINS